MLYVALMKAKPGTAQERIKRRLGWDRPEGAKVVAEYWVQSPDPTVISVFEADRIEAIWAVFVPWDDLFEITVHPAIEAEEGLGILREMFQG